MAQPPEEFVALPGSERPPLAGALAGAPEDGAVPVEVTVVLRPRTGGDPVAEVARRAAAPAPGPAALGRAAFAARHGADPGALERVAAYARARGLEVLGADPDRRSVRLRGPATAVGGAFGVELRRFDHPDGGYRGHAGPVALPRSLAAVVVAVLGLDDRPQARPRLSRMAVAPAAAGAAFTPPEVAALYAYPPGSTGQGQTIGLIELGGGYDPAGIAAYFSGLGLRAPDLTAVGVDGAANQPTGTPNGPDGEVQLDIEVAGAVAPGAALAVYFAPNTDAGFMDAVTTAIHDHQRAPAVLSISWGSAESTWSAAALTAFDAALADAALLGVTVCCAAGDQGSGDGVGDGLAHVDFPAASPHVLGCGGTSLAAAAGAITSEVVWNDASGATGGGVSAVFPLPAWQAGARVPPSANPGGHRGRGVPDVAGDADPVTGYRVQVDGQVLVFGGTSAVAPLWAGLVARLNAALGHPVGYLNPVLYPLAATQPVTRDITQGGNGAYRAAVGWDPCTGLGTPIGQRLLAALTKGPAPAVR